MSSAKEKISYKRNIKEYLRQLDTLLKVDVSGSSLESIDNTNRIANSFGLGSCAESFKKTIEFKKKESGGFLLFLDCLYQLDSSSVYVWTELTKHCGTMEIESVRHIDTGVGENITSSGVITFVSKSMRNSLTFDIEVEEDGRSFLEIEINGYDWPRCADRLENI